MKSTYNQHYTSFIKRLRQAREERACSQAELAARLGKPQSYVSKVESGQRRMDLVEYAYWSKALEIDGALFFNRLAEDVSLPLPNHGRAKSVKPKSS